MEKNTKLILLIPLLLLSFYFVYGMYNINNHDYVTLEEVNNPDGEYVEFSSLSKEDKSAIFSISKYEKVRYTFDTDKRYIKHYSGKYYEIKTVNSERTNKESTIYITSIISSILSTVLLSRELKTYISK